MGYLMNHRIKAHRLKGPCPRSSCPPYKVHLIPMGRHNYPRRHLKLEGYKTHPSHKVLIIYDAS